MPPARRSARATSSQHNGRSSAQPYTRANRQRSPASASIARPASGKTSLRLTVKAPPSKLRQATSGSSIPPNPYTDASESDTTPQPAVTRAARSTRNPRAVVEQDSDEDEDEEEEVEEEDEEQIEEEDDEDDDEEDVDAEDEDEEMEDAQQVLRTNDDSNDSAVDDDGDEEEEEEEEEDEGTEDELILAEHPPRPIVKQDRSSGKSAPNVTVTAPPEGPLQSVEDKEMEDDDEDELSELDSNENDEEDESDSNDDDDEGMSRSATPDLSKLTRRQRGHFEEVDASLMALSNEAQKKKHLTAEEHAVRRAEMARRRKNLSEKRNEEEKMDTINKLLKKPAPKRRTRAEILAAHQADSLATPGAEDGEEERPDPLFVRWVNARDGSRLGVPEEWLEAPIGEAFLPAGGSRMVEEVA